MSRQYWVAPISPLHTADGTAYANSITLTDVAPTPAILIPANLLEPGSTFEVTAFGRFSTTTTPTLILGVYSGTVGQAIGSAVSLAATSAVTTPTTVTNQTFKVAGNFRCRTNGASGTVMGVLEVSNISTTATNMGPATAPATATIDTTVARYITLGATWGTQSVSNTLTVHHFEVRIVS